MKKSAADLQSEVSSLTNAEDEKMKAYFAETLESCNKLLGCHEEKLEQYQKIVLFFGESSSNDIAGFFGNWNKFIASFRASIKFNVGLAKKRLAEEKKKRVEKKLQKEEKQAQRFKNTLRQSGKFAPQLKKSPRGKPGGMRVSLVIDDILADNEELFQGPSEQISQKNGIVKQISHGLQKGDTFSRLRGKRMQKLKKEPSNENISMSPTTKRQLARQQSTFSKRKGLSPRARESNRPNLANIQWG